MNLEQFKDLGGNLQRVAHDLFMLYLDKKFPNRDFTIYDEDCSFFFSFEEEIILCRYVGWECCSEVAYSEKNYSFKELFEELNKELVPDKSKLWD